MQLRNAILAQGETQKGLLFRLLASPHENSFNLRKLDMLFQILDPWSDRCNTNKLGIRLANKVCEENVALKVLL